MDRLVSSFSQFGLKISDDGLYFSLNSTKLNDKRFKLSISVVQSHITILNFHTREVGTIGITYFGRRHERPDVKILMYAVGSVEAGDLNNRLLLC